MTSNNEARSRRAGGSVLELYTSTHITDEDTATTTVSDDVEAGDIIQKGIARAGAIATFVSIIKNAVGAGLVVMPLLGHNASAAVTFALVGFTFFMASASHAMLGAASSYTRRFSYGELTRLAFGDKAAVVVVLCVMGLLAVAAPGCFMVLSSTTADLLRLRWPSLEDTVLIPLDTDPDTGETSYGRLWMLHLIWALLLLPLFLQRTINALRHGSAIGVTAISVMVLATVYLGIAKAVPEHEFDGGKGRNWADFDPVATMSLVALVSIAYMSHFNAPQMCGEMKVELSEVEETQVNKEAKKRTRRFAKLSVIAFVVIALLNAMFFFFSYRMLGEAPKSSVLSNTEFGGAPGTIARFAIICAMAAEIPLLFIGFRSLSLAFMSALLEVMKKDTALSNCSNLSLVPSKWFYGASTACLLWVIAIASLCKSVNTPFEIAGALPGNIMTYILPPLIMYRVVPQHVLTRPVKLGLLTVALFGCLCVIGSSFSVVYSWVHGSEE
ncbi:MAG: hypothetical protein MHM6MM_003409 [Cercozoa sp. M6MM]